MMGEGIICTPTSSSVNSSMEIPLTKLQIFFQCSWERSGLHRRAWSVLQLVGCFISMSSRAGPTEGGKISRVSARNAAPGTWCTTGLLGVFHPEQYCLVLVALSIAILAGLMLAFCMMPGSFQKLLVRDVSWITALRLSIFVYWRKRCLSSRPTPVLPSSQLFSEVNWGGGRGENTWKTCNDNSVLNAHTAHTADIKSLTVVSN